MKALRALDPGFTVQNLEDRASVLFWRKLDSERRGSARSLGSVARAEFLAEHARRLEEGERYFLGDGAVGSVELQAILPGEAWDRALVELAFYETAEDGLPISERLATFAGDNEMSACAPPIDLSR